MQIQSIHEKTFTQCFLAVDSLNKFKQMMDSMVVLTMSYNRRQNGLCYLWLKLIVEIEMTKLLYVALKHRGRQVQIVIISTFVLVASPLIF